MITNRSMPPGDVIPELPYTHVHAAARWLCTAFGFRERLRIGGHRIQLLAGHGSVVVVERDPGSQAPGSRVMVRVPDVDAHYTSAIAAGAQVIGKPTTYPYGERQYSALDPGGHSWTFSQSVADSDPATWGGELVAPPGANVTQAVPFFGVSDMSASLRFYVDGLGFEMKLKWMFEGTVRWCWLQRGDGALMLQDFRRDGGGRWQPDGTLGLGVSIAFVCEDALALYREFTSRGIEASRPFVGNGMWVTSLRDPDGYRVEFESYTDTPEETQYEE